MMQLFCKFIPQDVATVASQLPNLLGSFEVDWPQFNHFDLVLAKDVVPLVYNHVISFLQYHK